jgi:hypothetical protein
MDNSLIKYVNIREQIRQQSEIVDVVNEETWNILYYLYLDEEVVYVGQSKDVNEHTQYNRINQHRKDKLFNRYRITKIPKELDIKICETYEILKHNPVGNRTLPCNYVSTLTALTSVNEGQMIIDAKLNRMFNFG